MTVTIDLRLFILAKLVDFERRIRAALGSEAFDFWYQAAMWGHSSNSCSIDERPR